MNITKAIAQLQRQLVRDINEAGLPPAVVALVMDGIRYEIGALVEAEMRKEDTENAGSTDAAEQAG